MTYTRMIRTNRDMAGRLIEQQSITIADDDLLTVFNATELKLLAKGETVILCDGGHEVFSHYTLPAVN